MHPFFSIVKNPKNTSLPVTQFLTVRKKINEFKFPEFSFYSKLATVVEGNLKAPFSIATPLRFKGGRYSSPWITPLYP